MKVSIIIPVYFNENNLIPLYEDIKTKYINQTKHDYEIVMIDDGSTDNSWGIMQDLAAKDTNVHVFKLSRNFGSHAAILCGLDHCTGDCAVIKAADLQEPTELLLEMVEKWEKGDRVVLAVRGGREENKGRILFADLYYAIVRKLALANMPRHGFDIYLIDRKVINVISALDERNSALTGQILWSGFKTGYVEYVRREREIGRSRWTLKKKIRLVMDTLFSFSTFPIMLIEVIGGLSFLGSIVWAIFVLICKLNGLIPVQGWTTLLIFNLFSFGMIMMTLGILGEYLWRSFDASRGRPTYIVEEERAGEERKMD